MYDNITKELNELIKYRKIGSIDDSVILNERLNALGGIEKITENLKRLMKYEEVLKDSDEEEIKAILNRELELKKKLEELSGPSDQITVEKIPLLLDELNDYRDMGHVKEVEELLEVLRDYKDLGSVDFIRKQLEEIELLHRSIQF